MLAFLCSLLDLRLHWSLSSAWLLTLFSVVINRSACYHGKL